MSVFPIMYSKTVINVVVSRSTSWNGVPFSSTIRPSMRCATSPSSSRNIAAALATGFRVAASRYVPFASRARNERGVSRL